MRDTTEDVGLREAAEITGIAYHQLWTWCVSNRIPASRVSSTRTGGVVNGGWRLKVADLPKLRELAAQSRVRRRNERVVSNLRRKLAEAEQKLSVNK